MVWPLRKARSQQPANPEAYGPPLAPEELTGNLSELERQLNGEMKCTAGKNQVYIRALVTGRSTARPRIALRCPFRKDIGKSPHVFYEHIRDVCCGDPDQCEAWRRFKRRHGMG